MKAFYLDAIPHTHNTCIAAKEGCVSDKIASIVVDEDSLVLQCDEYVLNIYKNNNEYIVNGNCTGEAFNTLSAALLANDNFTIKNNIESLIKDMNQELATYILSVLVYDMNMFIRCSK